MIVGVILKDMDSVWPIDSQENIWVMKVFNGMQVKKNRTVMKRILKKGIEMKELKEAKKKMKYWA